MQSKSELQSMAHQMEVKNSSNHWKEVSEISVLLAHQDRHNGRVTDTLDTVDDCALVVLKQVC